MPLIAIAPCRRLHDYKESVRRAGGDVRILDLAIDKVADVVRSVDGLLLTGGSDVLPSIYGEPVHPTFEAAEPGRDDYELELVRRASDGDLPLLAICRGIQVLNVARGGSLIQDIPTEPGFGRTSGSEVDHDLKPTRVAIAHDVWIASGTTLDALMQDTGTSGACPVNSRHHQAVKTPGAGLVVTATAPDGVIEAIEDPSRRFCVGVQWHPENFYRTGKFRAMFEGLVDAARRT
jgi:putative glutamine amidotransferase